MLDQGGCLSLYRLPCRVDHTAGVDRIRYGCDLTALRGSSIARHTAPHVLKVAKGWAMLNTQLLQVGNWVAEELLYCIVRVVARARPFVITRGLKSRYNILV